MTCVAGIATDEGVWMAADSAAVDPNSWHVNVQADPKVFRKGPFLIGYTTSFRMGQLVRYDLEIPEHPDGLEGLAFIISKFIPALRECLTRGGCSKKENNVEEGGEFLVGYRGALYDIQAHFQVIVPGEEYAACGSGWAVALGALHALRRWPAISPEERVRAAVEAAIAHNIGVRGPVVVEFLPKEGE